MGLLDPTITLFPSWSDWAVQPRLLSRQRSDQVELLALWVGVDRTSLVVIHQLVECVELTLADTVEGALHLDAEVFVASRSLQRDGVVAHL